MRNRDLIIRKIEQLESKYKHLQRIVQQNEPLETYISTIQQSEEILSEIKSMVDNQPMSPEEINNHL